MPGAPALIASRWVVGALPEQGRALREAVFCQELGWDADQAFDARDDQAWHLIVFEQEKCIGTGRLFVDRDGSWRISHIAVVPEKRRQSVGDLIIRLMVYRLYDMPPAPIKAKIPQQYAVLFEKIGFFADGEPQNGWQEMVFPKGGELHGSCHA